MLDDHLVANNLTSSEIAQSSENSIKDNAYTSPEPIAVIGMGCRFPGGANSPGEFWQLLMNEQNAATIIPEDRWPLDDFYDPDPEAPGKCYTRTAHFLTNPSPVEFDAEFFRITPREAKVLDPQQRIILEVVWEALENAGIAPTSLYGSDTGVFMGCYDNHYLSDFDLRAAEDVQFYLASSMAQSITVGRVSYFLNLHGPNLAIDTACSSSLIALHHACQSLRSGECNLALTGGVNVIVSPSVFIALAQGKMLSQDGLCKAFDNTADGYGRGEGCGVIVLKRLQDALKDGDTVLALIRGSAINHDGRTAGITAPSSTAQQMVIQLALLNSGIKSSDIHYVEAHGTGTTVGDPIELAALAETFTERGKDNALRIGSVKTNIGHLEAAAGIAGVIKTILALNHEYLPRHLNVSELSTQIDWEEVPLQVLTEGESWPKGTRQRFAGVSSFGFGGSNAHLILEGAEFVNRKPIIAPIDRPKHILTLSAHNDQGLQALSQRYADYFLSQPEAKLADITYSANVGRAHLRTRLAVVGEKNEDVASALEDFISGERLPATLATTKTSYATQQIGFLFTGQGAQYPGMGQGLFEYLPSFREKLEMCDRILSPHIGQSLIDILYKTKAPRKQHPINQTALTQPALFALEVSLAQMLIEWGIRPAAVMGHSLGESVASYVSGVYSLEDGLHMVAQRGALMQSLPHNGIMVAVETGAQTIQSLIDAHAYNDSAGIAAYNGPHSIVISGKMESVEHISQLLKEQGIRIVPLRVSHAFHSELMTPMVAPFIDFISHLNLSIPQIPLVSTVTGQLVTNEITSAEHWGKGVRQAVRFEQAIKSMINMGIRTFVEIGPHPVLSGMGRNCARDNVNLNWLPLLRKGRDDWSTLLQTLGQLYSQGIDVDWKAFDADFKQSRRKVQLPTYVFQRQKHWMNSLPPKYQSQDSHSRYSLDVEHPLLGQQLQLPGKHATYYETKLTPQKPRWIKGHKFFNQCILPAAAYLEMAMAMASLYFKSQNIQLNNIVLHNLLHVVDEGVIVQCVLHEDSGSTATFEIYSHPAVTPQNQTLQWDLHATGLISDLNEIVDTINFRDRIVSRYDTMPYVSTSGQHYKSFHLQGLTYGQEFQAVNDARYSDREAIAQVTLSPDTLANKTYHIHPAILDGGMQLAGIILPVPPVQHNNVPIRIDKVRFYGRQLTLVWCLCESQNVYNVEDSRYKVDVTYCDNAGTPIVIMDGVEFQTMREEIFRLTPPKWREWIYKIGWHRLINQDHDSQNQDGGWWLIFNDTQGVGEQLALEFHNSGQTGILVNKGNQYTKFDEVTYQINPTNAVDYQLLLGSIESTNTSDSRLQGIVHLWSLDLSNPISSEAILTEILDYSVGSTLSIVQTILGDEVWASVKLRLVTRGAIAVGEDDIRQGFIQAPIWGLGRVINLEHPEFKCRMIDLDPEKPQDEIEVLITDIQLDDNNSEIVYRQGNRLIPKLVDVDEPDHAIRESGELIFPRSTTYGLKCGERGSLDALYLAPMTRQLPGPNELEIAVRATGLNFIDVLDVMGLLPFERPSLGGECAGVVTAIGETVTHFKVGDSVVALAPGSFNRYVISSEELAVLMPDGLSYEQAASIPIVYLTAYFALYHTAKLNSKDRVLIHAAAGGVGYAALQLAKRAGAEIYATASPPKWDFLGKQGLGHIMNSRTLDFESEILTVTDGQGVDVVLNSLSGDFIPASLSAVALNGRFVEIGKRAVWSQSQVNQLRPDIDYAVYDLITHMINTPSEVGDALHQIFKWVANGELLPPPITPYPIQASKEAFRFMQQAKHIGKIVLTQSELPNQSLSERRHRKLDGAYLVTGGWGALGLEVVSWLVYRGAPQIIVVSRSKPNTETMEVVDNIRNAGTQIVILTADVTDYDALSYALNHVDGSQLPLRGVFHIAGVLHDSTIGTLTREQLEKVMKVKVQGAWNLHQLTFEQSLDFFVMFSSVASVFGSLGQANYAAANAFLDSLAHYRKNIGKPALSINWGAWSDGGMATRAGTDNALEDFGVLPIPPLEGMELFQNIVLGDYTQTVVFPVDWQLANQSRAVFTPLFSEFLNSKMPNDNWQHILDEILESPRNMQRSKLASYVREIVSHVLRIPSSTPIDDRDSFVDLGMDSLMTVELRNLVQRSFNCALPATLFINYPTIDALITYLTDRLHISELNQISTDDSNKSESLSDNLDTLTVDEIAQQLDKKLDLLEQYTNE